MKFKFFLQIKIVPIVYEARKTFPDYYYDYYLADSILGNRENNLFRIFFSSLFQYSERTIIGTKTNDTLAESP